MELVETQEFISYFNLGLYYYLNKKGKTLIPVPQLQTCMFQKQESVNPK